MVNASELRDWNEYLKLFIGLFVIVDPLSLTPIFLGMVRGRTDEEKRRVVSYASLAFSLALLLFVFFGKAILDVFAIRLSSFRIAGGLLLLIMSFEMLRTRIDSGSGDDESSKGDVTSVAIVPIAIPLLAGPGDW